MYNLDYRLAADMQPSDPASRCKWLQVDRRIKLREAASLPEGAMRLAAVRVAA